ncbi:hypothetical protein [Rhodococcus opacus]|uniref:hypothetical protein n=1 Tax=Rhodococcus opacus TaxID=37919 RepID=UPI0013001DD7|nr:hypothetical protein [Rhodococcus opacus]
MPARDLDVVEVLGERIGVELVGRLLVQLGVPYRLGPRGGLYLGVSDVRALGSSLVSGAVPVTRVMRGGASAPRWARSW